MPIDPLSASSLFLRVFANETYLGTATGFLVEHANKKFLVTNWHVVTGSNPTTGVFQQSQAPTRLRIPFLVGDPANNVQWQEQDVELFQDGQPCWLEHPNGQPIDVVALEIADEIAGPAPTVNLDLADVDMIPSPGHPVFVVGFPEGFTGGGALAIWKGGTIASEHDVNALPDGPCFLVDASTRGGMSGSPVFMRASNYQSSTGWNLGAGFTTRFLGVYSGRLSQTSDVGIVWRPNVVNEVLANQTG